MYRLGVADHVMIAHSLAGEFFGPAQRLHGATFAVELEVSTRKLGPHRVVMDIGALRDLLRKVLGTLDYRNLDEHPAFVGELSTTEAVAEYVANQVAEELSVLPNGEVFADGGSVRVLIRESPVAYASYERDL